MNPTEDAIRMIGSAFKQGYKDLFPGTGVVMTQELKAAKTKLIEGMALHAGVGAVAGAGANAIAHKDMSLGTLGQGAMVGALAGAGTRMGGGVGSMYESFFPKGAEAGVAKTAEETLSKAGASRPYDIPKPTPVHSYDLSDGAIANGYMTGGPSAIDRINAAADPKIKNTPTRKAATDKNMKWDPTQTRDYGNLSSNPQNLKNELYTDQHISKSDGLLARILRKSSKPKVNTGGRLW